MFDKQRSPYQDNETARIEAFSDGVFAIDITLLAYQLKGPGINDTFTSRTLLLAMLQQWPAYLAFMLSFATVFVIWVNHHRMFNVIRQSDGRFMYLNGLLLFLTSLIPLSTSLLATYIDTSADELATALSMSIFGAVASMLYGMWRYATNNYHLLKRPTGDVRIQAVGSGLLISIAGYGLAVLLALVLPLVSILIGLAMVVLLARLNYHRDRAV